MNKYPDFVEKLTDNYIDNGDYCEQDLIDLRDEYKKLYDKLKESPDVKDILLLAIDKIKKEKSSRENSLVLTNTQQALHWEYERINLA